MLSGPSVTPTVSASDTISYGRPSRRKCSCTRNVSSMSSHVKLVEKPPSSSITSLRQIWKAPTAHSIVFRRVQPRRLLKNDRR